MATKNNPLPDIAHVWIDEKGRPTLAFGQAMDAMSKGNFGPLKEAQNDAEAAAAGVPLNGLYHSSGGVRIRVA